MRHTAKSNLLNRIEIKRVSFMGNPDLRATVTDFMAILQSIDYSKFERVSNVADEISTKLLSRGPGSPGGPGGPDLCPFLLQPRLCPQILRSI